MSVLILPRSALIEINENTIKVEIPDEQPDDIKTKIAALEATYGILEDKHIDPLEYEWNMRNSWNER